MTGSGRHGGAFTPEVREAINRAYQDAIRALDIQASQSDRRADLARCIMDLASEGECDTARLRRGALALMARLERVRLRARRIWESEGRPEGLHDEHWLRAERAVEEEEAAATGFFAIDDVGLSATSGGQARPAEG